jgi:hypothetical protein
MNHPGTLKAWKVAGAAHQLFRYFAAKAQHREFHSGPLEKKRHLSYKIRIRGFQLLETKSACLINLLAIQKVLVHERLCTRFVH